MSTFRWSAIGSAALALTLFATACGGGSSADSEGGDLVEAAPEGRHRHLVRLQP